MSTSSSSAAHKKLGHVLAVANRLKCQMSELQALREKVERTEHAGTLQTAPIANGVQSASLTDLNKNGAEAARN